MTSERQREIEQGLREPSGALIGGLHVEDYVRGHKDYEAGNPPPDGLTSVSYDLGRRRAAEKAERLADMLRAIDDRNAESHRRVREMLAHKPELLAEYEASMERVAEGVRREASRNPFNQTTSNELKG